MPACWSRGLWFRLGLRLGLWFGFRFWLRCRLGLATLLCSDHAPPYRSDRREHRLRRSLALLGRAPVGERAGDERGDVHRRVAPRPGPRLPERPAGGALDGGDEIGRAEVAQALLLDGVEEESAGMRVLARRHLDHVQALVLERAHERAGGPSAVADDRLRAVLAEIDEAL